MQPHPYSAVLKSARGVGGGASVVGGGRWRVRPGIYQHADRCLRCRTKVFGVISGWSF